GQLLEVGVELVDLVAVILPALEGVLALEQEVEPGLRALGLDTRIIFRILGTQVGLVWLVKLSHGCPPPRHCATPRSASDRWCPSLSARPPRTRRPSPAAARPRSPSRWGGRRLPIGSRPRAHSRE